MAVGSTLVTVPARQGKAVRLNKGESIRVVNTHGSQVVDTWAFKADDLHEFMSMEHTRSAILSLLPKVGDVLVTGKRRPILTLVEDTSPGVHDTCMSACDIYRYRGLGVEGHHDSCTDNLFKGMKDIGLEPPECPSPLNLWMNVPMTSAQDGGKLHFAPPVSKPGDFVTLRAEMDCIMCFSACPQDMLPINGTLAKALLDPSERSTIYDAHFEVLPASAFPADKFPVPKSMYFLQS